MIKVFDVTSLHKKNYVRTFLLEKKERKVSVDGTRLKIKSDDGIFSLDFKDWEANVIITALSKALFIKHKIRLEKKYK